MDNRIQKFLTRERAVLMVCISIALCFWVLNRLSTKFRKTTPIQLEYFTPMGKALRMTPPQYANVSWQGTGWDLLTGSEPRIALTVETDSIQTFYLRTIAAQQLGNDVFSVSPEQITVEIEDITTKSVPVEAVTALSFWKGFDLADDIQFTPSVIAVEGAKSVLENLNSLKTDTLRFQKLKDTVVTTIKLAAIPILKFGKNEVTARLAVEQFTEKSLFVPLTVRNAPQRLQIFPNKIKLDCTVALSRYASLSGENFTAVVDLKNVDVKSKNNTVAIVLLQQPSFVRNVKFSPQSVEFYFEK
jgi:YbbR domain-containing protein